MVRARMRVVLCLILLFAGAAQAEEKEPTAIVELGAAGEWDFPSGRLGPTAAAEFTPIKNWLESRRASRRCSAAVKQNGALIFCSKSRSPCLTKWNSCSVSGRNGRSHATGQKLLARLQQISCSGQRRIESSDGF
jgi:hypothetical protein